MGHGTNHELFAVIGRELGAVRSALLHQEAQVKELHDRAERRHAEVLERLDRLLVLQASGNVLTRFFRGRRG